MSFILDALKKSETERQEQGSAEFSSVPASSEKTSPARWLWLLAALLAVNIAVLIGILLKPDAPDMAAPEVAVTNTESAVVTTTQPEAEIGASFEERVADAIEDRPVIAPPAQSTREDIVESTVTPAPQTVTRAATRATSIPTIDQLRLDGSLQVDELHLDIHVYSDDPAERFVFINMDKHREDSRTKEGPVVREITPDGVILDHQGRSFLLPRE
ncbi:MAG: general secretion pathway protein GspB [Woeseiaceae bacterium]